ncbi:RAMP superfamily CRISPR-associated protein [Nostoc sp. 'Peltigera membranacea cyanobiont' 232]|uniref:RAMP superfamily CRISPR-associated protein n=1 Tax=Nostoc sp. 'Peltigera membranacea cyanobiont' 232 TaxID=2014531 RepID=UPI000B951B63|nr:RAMP superfamily CRISPR-associated protein [Nostoc sp. 'Peltigera membranacea cyanobiont' 232]OYE01002.1 type III-B CRISPR module RAMP protein Cmr4 [Nostoc sp. 'Peltigera membranacea cyanobiont' 232]
MYQKAYGIIETLAPLHIGASAGEETGNLNLIFRDQFTQTGIIPGSSIRGRFRADMRFSKGDATRPGLGNQLTNIWYGHQAESDEDENLDKSVNKDAANQEQTQSKNQDKTTEALVKFEYASLVWLPIFCPGQPIVWVTCPRLLKRYKQITGIQEEIPKTRDAENNPLPYPVKLNRNQNRLFFNLGFLDNLQPTPSLSKWIPPTSILQPDSLVVVDDNDIRIIHEMGLYRQTRTKLNEDVKKVENFFGFEALPEDSILIFPVAIKKDIPQYAQEKLNHLKQDHQWQPFSDRQSQQLYFGGLESIGCGRCQVTLTGEYFQSLNEGDN